MKVWAGVPAVDVAPVVEPLVRPVVAEEPEVPVELFPEPPDAIELPEAMELPEAIELLDNDEDNPDCAKAV